jgi:penicillin-binding protein 1A
LCALLVVQDPTFYRHHGVGLTGGPLGHTTITQGLGKAFFFDHYDPGPLHYRKLKLIVAAWGLDRSVAKGMQLRVFVNRAYLGSHDGQEIFGFPAAAKALFGKTLESLSDRQYFALLAMLDAPNNYHVLRHPELNAARVHSIEQRVQVACGPGCFAGNYPVPCGQDERRIESGVRY